MDIFSQSNYIDCQVVGHTDEKLKFKNSFGSFAVIFFRFFFFFLVSVWFKWNLFLDILPKFSFSFGFYGNSAWCVNCCCWWLLLKLLLFCGWDRCTTWRRRRRSDSSSCGTLSLFLRLVAVSFAAVISLSVHWKGFPCFCLFVCIGLVTLFTVCLLCSFWVFQYFQYFQRFLKLTFWNCASLFVWNTWEFCQQSIAWHQQIHGTTTLVSLCCCCCCCGFIICWLVFFFFLLFIQKVHCSIFEHSLLLTFHFFVHFLLICFLFRIFFYFVCLSRFHICFGMLHKFVVLFFGCLANCWSFAKYLRNFSEIVVLVLSDNTVVCSNPSGWLVFCCCC